MKWRFYIKANKYIDARMRASSLAIHASLVQPHIRAHDVSGAKCAKDAPRFVNAPPLDRVIKQKLSVRGA